MPQCTESVHVYSGRPYFPAPSCVHQWVRIDTWSESEISEARITDDFGQNTGPVFDRRMTTTYEKYRCKLCGEEDIQSYTTWDTQRH